MSTLAEFSALALSLERWRSEIVFVGGWAFRLYQYEPRAYKSENPPIFTKDADVAYEERAKLAGDIRQALEGAGFQAQENFSGDFDPLAMRYVLGGDANGFYAEFLTPQTDSPRRRIKGTNDTEPDATERNAGIVATKLRHLEVLMHEPWSVTIPADESGLDAAIENLRIPNPTSFIVQKLLIRGERSQDKRAQDMLYIYDTMLGFNALIEDDLAKIWERLRPKLTPKQRASVDNGVAELFGEINDTIRAAVDIRKDVRVEPLDMLRLCQNGFQDLFRGAV